MRASSFSLDVPGTASPDRSPLMSATKTGTPAADRPSVSTWSVLVLPVPVAPGDQPVAVHHRERDADRGAGDRDVVLDEGADREHRPGERVAGDDLRGVLGQRGGCLSRRS